jgi:dUTP pyrophosphatase
LRAREPRADAARGSRAPSSGPEVTIRFVRLPHGVGLPDPARASSSSAGSDLRAALAATLTLRPGERALVPTGLALEIPPGWEGQVRPRSGLARDHGVTVLNAPGTIDADYRGEVGVLLVNLGAEPYSIERGERIAQIVFAPIAQASWREVPRLETTERGTGGFGSTGTG